MAAVSAAGPIITSESASCWAPLPQTQPDWNVGPRFEIEKSCKPQLMVLRRTSSMQMLYPTMVHNTTVTLFTIYKQTLL